MRNLKHAMAGFIAVAMISSLAIAQGKEISNEKNNLKMLSAGAVTNTITIQDGSIIDNISNDEQEEETVDFDTKQELSEEEIQEITEKKSNPEQSYVVLSSGTLAVRETPSDEAKQIDTIQAMTEVKIFESTEGWYKIAYGQGQMGYVPCQYITQDKAKAEYEAKHYDNYRKGTVTINGESVRVRQKPDTSSSILTELENGAKVVLLWNEGDFVKVCYGSDYQEGYIIATALQINEDEWIAKSEVSAKQKEAQQKIEAQKKADEEKKAAEKKAEEEKKKSQETKTTSKSTSSSASYFNTSSNAQAPSSSKGQAIVNEAKKYLGVKYVYGGTTPKGFDCSGLVQYVCAKNGISLNRTAAAQSTQGVAVSKSNLQPGDLLFFASGGRVHHVGIYVGNGQMIHAPQTGDVVKYSSINTAYRLKEFCGARRVY